MTVQTTNGVDVPKVMDLIESVRENPSMANYQFHIHNRWHVGGYNETTVESFRAAGTEIPHEHTFEIEADEPILLAGEDQAPNPVEYLLHALVSCVTSSMVYHAAARGIQIDELESELEGDIDLRGFLGISEDVRKGYENIRVKFRIRTDCEDLNRLRELCEFSPVLDVTRHGTNVSIELERK